MSDNLRYAKYMISQLERLVLPDLEIARNAFEQVCDYWLRNDDVDLNTLREELWTWVDQNDGYNTQKRNVVKMRMILCLAYEDNRDLEDMGYFEDLLLALGIGNDI